MIKTPVATSSMSIPLSAPGMNAAIPSDPRAKLAVPPTQPPPPMPVTTLPSDPRARPADPRAARDPRAAAAPNFPPPPIMQPPPQMPPQVTPAVAGLDPNLVQQVMSLTPAQIAQLPPDKQQSIIALRQTITGRK